MMPVTLRMMTMRMKRRKRRKKARARVLSALASAAKLVALATTPPKLLMDLWLIGWP